MHIYVHRNKHVIFFTLYSHYLNMYSVCVKGHQRIKAVPRPQEFYRAPRILNSLTRYWYFVYMIVWLRKNTMNCLYNWSFYRFYYCISVKSIWTCTKKFLDQIWIKQPKMPIKLSGNLQSKGMARLQNGLIQCHLRFNNTLIQKTLKQTMLKSHLENYVYMFIPG